MIAVNADSTRLHDSIATQVASTVSELMTHVTVLRQYARRLTGNVADADDLVQECVVRALSKLEQFEPGTNLVAWLRVILENVFLEGVRKTARRQRFLAPYATSKQRTISLPNQLARLEIRSMAKALDELPPLQRSALIMVAIDGLSYEEVSQKAGVPVGTVRSRVSRARTSLADLCDGIETHTLRSSFCSRSQSSPDRRANRLLKGA